MSRKDPNRWAWKIHNQPSGFPPVPVQDASCTSRPSLTARPHLGLFSPDVHCRGEALLHLQPLLHQIIQLNLCY